MRLINRDQTNAYLSEIGMSIGSWNQITNGTEGLNQKSPWISCRAPEKSRELHNFAQHVIKWLPRGVWKIVQIDNSTSPSQDEAFLINRLLFGSSESSQLPLGGALLFEFVKGADANEDLLLSNLVFLLLLFECHGQVVSSSCRDGKILSVQDGFVYFISHTNSDISDARMLLKQLEDAPLKALSND
jgi:hypothetical protein